MYLHYYLNEKYVGPVDIEAFFDVKNRKSLITCSQDCEDHVGALEMMYGRKIERFASTEAYDIRHLVRKDKSGRHIQLPDHIFTTKKCGRVLGWSDYDRTLLCNS